MAITDHDTAGAYPELKEACEDLGLECIFGGYYDSYPTREELLERPFYIEP